MGIISEYDLKIRIFWIAPHPDSKFLHSRFPIFKMPISHFFSDFHFAQTVWLQEMFADGGFSLYIEKAEKHFNGFKNYCIYNTYSKYLLPTYVRTMVYHSNSSATRHLDTGWPLYLRCSEISRIIKFEKSSLKTHILSGRGSSTTKYRLQFLKYAI